MEYQTRSPGSVVDDVGIGTRAWANPLNAKVSDNLYAQTSGSIGNPTNTEYIIKIVKNGVITGENKSTGASLPASDTYVSYGNSTDLWGETWTAEDINNGNFGFVFSAKVEFERPQYTHYLIHI